MASPAPFDVLPGAPPRDPPDFGGDDEWGGGGGGGGGGGDGFGPSRDDSIDDERPRVMWVTVASFIHPAAAHIARLRLEGAGVACVLLDELTAATNCLSLCVGGVKLKVPAADAARAMALLRARAADAAPTVAVYPDRTTAVMAACVVEAGRLACRVVEAEAHAAVECDADDLARAASALAHSPFAAGLTDAAVAAAQSRPCPSCGGRSRADWFRAVAATGRRVVLRDFDLANRLRGWLVARLASRRCQACGLRY